MGWLFCVEVNLTESEQPMGVVRLEARARTHVVQLALSPVPTV